MAPIPGPVFDTYWRFAAARHDVYLKRLRGEPPPWTTDSIIGSFRFTNVYRATDRVSQYLIRNVIYTGDPSADEVAFRILLFKWFNRVDTWQLLTERLGPLRLATFDPSAAERVLTAARAAGRPVYSAAYILPPVPEAAGPKHAGHISLTMRMLEAGITEHIQRVGCLQGVYEWLRRSPGVGPFLAYQMAIDLNYSPIIDYDEDEFVVPGPGALDGLSKAFPDASSRDAATLIEITKNEQQEHFRRLALDFPGLFGRPLKLIDCQNLYCELSKYARVAHPDTPGVAGRTRIKQVYRATPSALPLPPPVFPPKWALEVPDRVALPQGSQPSLESPLTLDLQFA